MVFDPNNPTAGRGDDPVKPGEPGINPPENPTKPPEGPVGVNPPDKPAGDPPLKEELKDKLVKRKIFQRVVVDNQAPLHLCNLVASGMTVKEATEKILDV